MLIKRLSPIGYDEDHIIITATCGRVYATSYITYPLDQVITKLISHNKEYCDYLYKNRDKEMSLRDFLGMHHSEFFVPSDNEDTEKYYRELVSFIEQIYKAERDKLLITELKTELDWLKSR